jgi:hypothetical protein
VDFENHGIHVQIVDSKKQAVARATVHLDGPAPQDTVADEHGFVTFWGLVAGEYTVHGKSRTGVLLPPAKITYPTAKTAEGVRSPQANDDAPTATGGPNQDGTAPSAQGNAAPSSEAGP